MSTTVNAGARLDRLPISSFHHRIFWLVGAGMFFDGYDLYVAGSVLAATISTKFSTLPQNLQFISLTFVGMTIGAFVTGFLGDWFGRRFTYQINLLIFGPRLARGGLRPGYGAAHHLSLRAGAWPRRRDRGRLFNADRVRTARIAREMALLYGVARRRRLPGDLHCSLI